MHAPAQQLVEHRLDDVGSPGGGPATLPLEHRLDDVVRPGFGVPIATGSRALEDALPGRPARSGHVVEPLAPGRYRVQFTAGEALRAKLERLQVLMADAVPDGDLAVLIEAAVTAQIERLERQRLAATTRPRTSVTESDTRPGPPHIPAAVKRVVRERDGDRCAYVDREGRRCSERRHLQFHHRQPHALGGDRTPRNITRYCARHNAYEALHDLGCRVARTPP
jgi:hypothetical protein